MIPHGGIPYESLTGISGKIIGTDIKPGSLSGTIQVTDIMSGKITNEALIPSALSGLIETIVTRRFNSAVPLSNNTAVYVNASGFADLALASTSGTMPCIGITGGAFASGVQATIIQHGIKEGIVTSSPQNTPFYVSEVSAGLIQTEIPATGFIQRLGYATWLSGQAMVKPDNFYYNLSGFPVGVVVETP